eukprot:TRINITY_DN22956_c0_g1_i1.p1 TRINITY_DN22956_c0_g1~~TRINITY_DN22956_c0_g1_i1.p1  ORF type:complete len:253 (-),score=51.35 TRINITY_DN22956_c0_g1_i1:54-812(-)
MVEASPPPQPLSLQHLGAAGRTMTSSRFRPRYRKLAKRYHPDRNVDDPEAEARFKEVQEAHATLSDSWKRALYDQDLQFSKFGTAATQEVDREKWTEHWSKETPEEYEKRKERYRRYAAGERPDLPPDRFYIQWNIPLSIVAVGGIFYICVKAPDWLDAQSEPHFCDPMHDDTSVPLVRAFHNPVQNRWERLPEGSEPPTPRQLYAYYQKAKPELMEGLDIRILPKVSLTVLQVPRTSAVKSPLLSALAPAA